MCLTVQNTILPKIKKNGRITVYKMVDKRDGKIVTPFQGRKVNSGWLRAGNGRIPKNIRFDDEIEAGAIHCLENKKEAKERAANDGSFLLECEAYAKDFIARGQYNDLAFKKIYISKKQLDKIK